ncbi:DUF6172 family protein [Verrucomicrobiales bacterium]|nr:DUF6172 family protein [Verrucomicrobiales bacterium]
MKKTFPLEKSNHKPARVIESIKSDVRKYIKRERSKKLAEDVDFIDFNCRVGPSEESAKTAHVSAINAAIDTAAAAATDGAIYIEIISKPGRRTRKETDRKY